MDKSVIYNIELICVITCCGNASKIIKSARQYDVSGATVIIGKGTVKSKILDFLGLSDVRKEIVYMATDKLTAYKALEGLNREFEFGRAGHGIAFSTSIGSIVGTSSITDNKNDENGVDKVMYNIITTIVERGKAEEVVDAATKAGSKGATIINGRGSGIHETNRLFSMEIEPEKEIVIIISEKAVTKAIVNTIRENLKIDEPGKGIIYVQDINIAYGLHRD